MTEDFCPDVTHSTRIRRVARSQGARTQGMEHEGAFLGKTYLPMRRVNPEGRWEGMVKGRL